MYSPPPGVARVPPPPPVAGVPPISTRAGPHGSPGTAPPPAGPPSPPPLPSSMGRFGSGMIDEASTPQACPPPLPAERQGEPQDAALAVGPRPDAVGPPAAVGDIAIPTIRSRGADAIPQSGPGGGRLGAGAVSFVLHVIVLLMLALVATPQDPPRPIVVVINQVADEQPLDQQEPEVELPVVEPEAEVAAPEAVVADVPTDPFADLAAVVDDIQIADIAPLEPMVPENDLMADVRGARAPLADGAVGGEGPAGGGGAFGGEVGRRLEMAGAGSGDIQVSLAWNNFNDIDLHVVTPAGERIFFGHRRAHCGGRLDVDMNVAPETPMPVENVFWPNGRARSGIYTVFVHHFHRHVPIDPTPFEVYILVKGRKAVLKGVVVAGQGPVLVARFDLAGRGLPKGLGAQAEETDGPSE